MKIEKLNTKLYAIYRYEIIDDEGLTLGWIVWCEDCNSYLFETDGETLTYTSKELKEIADFMEKL